MGIKVEMPAPLFKHNGVQPAVHNHHIIAHNGCQSLRLPTTDKNRELRPK